MVFSSLYSMVGRNSIMAHCDAELKRGEETISSAKAGIQYLVIRNIWIPGLRYAQPAPAKAGVRNDEVIRVSLKQNPGNY
jgi:hypothetical protein